MFDVLKKKLYVKNNKCRFFRTQIELRGLVLSEEGVLVVLKRSRWWLGGPYQRIKLRSDAFWGWLLTWENM